MMQNSRKYVELYATSSRPQSGTPIYAKPGRAVSLGLIGSHLLPQNVQ